MAPPKLLTLPTDALIIILRLISSSDTINLRKTCRQFSTLPNLATDDLDMEGIGLPHIAEQTYMSSLECEELSLRYKASCELSDVQTPMTSLPEFALNRILLYISPSDTISLRQTCQAFRRLPMLSDDRYHRSWHISAEQRPAFPLTSLPYQILKNITDCLCPSDNICLRLSCFKFSDLPLPEVYELTDEDKDEILDTIEDRVERINVRKLLNRGASYVNGEIMEDWRIPGHLNEERRIAQRRYEHDYGRAKKPLELLFCNKCGKLKKAHHTTGFADGSSGLSVAVIRGRECIPCRVGRFDNLRVASIYHPVVNGIQMFACFLCKEARLLEEDGLEMWQSLDREELEANLVRGVAMVEQKFCKKCFENRKEMKLEETVQEVDYSKLITMMERMFPKMGKLDPDSVEKEERKEAEEEQRRFQEKLRKEAEEEAKQKLKEEQAQKAMLEEQIGSKMEDLELDDWNEDVEIATQANPTASPTFIEDNSGASINTNDASVHAPMTGTEAATTPPPRIQTEDRPVKRDVQFSSPILAAHDYNINDDDDFSDFELEDNNVDGQSHDTAFTSDDTIMDDVAATKDASAEDEFGWSSDMDGIETIDDVFSIPDTMPVVPAPKSTSDMDRMLWGGF